MPKIEAKCNKCGHVFNAGDLLPPSKARCPKCKNKGSTSIKLSKVTKKFNIMEVAKRL